MPVKSLLNDNELLAKIADRDQRAFRIIYDHYTHMVYARALRMTKDEMTAEEVMHEIFLKLWLMGNKLNTIQSLDAWLLTVTRNHCLTLIRQNLLATDAEKTHVANFSELINNTEEMISLKDTQKVISDAIDLLSPQQREIYLLCRNEELTYDAIAKRLNISPFTVQTHMKRALKSLRDYIKKNNELVGALILIKFL